MKTLTASQILLIETATETKIEDVLDMMSRRADGCTYANQIAHAITAVPDFRNTVAWSRVMDEKQEFEYGVLCSSWGYNYRMSGLEDGDYGEYMVDENWFTLEDAQLTRAARLIWLAAFHEDMEAEFAMLQKIVPSYMGGSSYEEDHDAQLFSYQETILRLRRVKSECPDLFI